jgi:DNA-binding transcriptional MerR regulator
MDTLQPLFTIQEAAEQTGLTVHTLRYYERIGVLMPIDRAANGHRRYSQADVNLIQLLACWLQTGMPLDAVQTYVRLVQEGEGTVAQRRELLEAHRESIVRQMEDLQGTLRLIDFKITYYQQVEEKQETAAL